MMPVDHCALHDSQSFAFANFVGDIDLEMIMGRGRTSRCAHENRFERTYRGS